MQDEKEISQLKNRFHDLADKSFRQSCYTFTGFLGLAEQELFHREEEKLRYAGFTLSGGFENADRVVVRFGNPEELGYEEAFPIVCIHVTPLAQKFADHLSHRDFLGALMNLGIRRSTLGDIKIRENQAYLFCIDSVAEFICANLEQVRHTHVKCTLAATVEEIVPEEPVRMGIHVSSLRADALVAGVYDLSRDKAQALFRAGKVYVSGRLCENLSRQVKCGETVNARGYGKFSLAGEPRETKKGRLAVDIDLYM